MKVMTMQEPWLTLYNIVIVIANSSPWIPLLLLGGTIVAYVGIPLVAEFVAMPYRAVRYVLHQLGLFQPKKTWSTVYDSQTKLPIDPAYVVVRTTTGVEVASAITDLNGRFVVILRRGLYTVDVQKTNYVFPSVTLFGQERDGEYTQLYFGETIEVLRDEQQLTISIPMDAIGKDWNQQEKKSAGIALRFGRPPHLTGVAIVYGVTGSIIAGSMFFIQRDLFSLQLLVIFAAVFLAMILWYVFSLDEERHSTVLDKKTGQPVAFARVTIFSAKTKIAVMKKTTSFNGTFVALLARGTYYVTIDKRDETGGYIPTFVSRTLRIGSGSLGRVFKI